MTKSKRFELIVFDWDGTLMDSTAAIALSLQAAARDLNLTVPSSKQAASVIGLNIFEAFQTALPDAPREDYPRITQRFRYHYFKKTQEVHLFNGIVLLLDELKSKDYLLAVATGKSRTGLNRVLNETHLNGYFDTTRTADETASKPAPDMLLEIMEELGVAPHKTLMIGDTSHDILMAHNAGVMSIAVQYGAHTVDDLAIHKPLFIARSVAHLHQWLMDNA